MHVFKIIYNCWLKWIGYANASFLRKPNISLGINTITIPTTRSSQQISDDNILFPRAHDRAKKFLIRLLKAELALAEKHRDDPSRTLIGPLLAKYSRMDALVKAFGNQFRAFGSDRAPFKAGRCPDVDSYKWWKNLMEDDDADILAVCFFSSLLQFNHKSTRFSAQRFLVFYPIQCQTNELDHGWRGSMHHIAHVRKFRVLLIWWWLDSGMGLIFQEWVLSYLRDYTSVYRLDRC